MTAVRRSMGPYTLVAYAHQLGNGLMGHIRTNLVLQIIPQYT